jgi:hypothetical protein
MRRVIQISTLLLAGAISSAAWAGSKVLADGTGCPQGTPTDQYLNGQCWYSDGAHFGGAGASGFTPSIQIGSVTADFAYQVDLGHGSIALFNGAQQVATIDVARPGGSQFWNASFGFQTGPGSVLDSDGNAQDAYRFLWNSVSDGSNASGASFEVVIFDFGGGGFELSFNYGFDAADIVNNPILNVTAGFQVGTDSQRITTCSVLLDPTCSTGQINHPGPDFFFANGALVGSAVTLVPEPGSIPLLLIGAMGIAMLSFPGGRTKALRSRLRRSS